MQVQDLALPGVKLLTPNVYRDDRGWFAEQYRQDGYRSLLGIPDDFVQGNLSQSIAGVLRGLHLQLSQPQGKLVCVLHGKIQDVLVDLRLESPSFGQSLSVDLCADTMQQLWVPPGFAHGFAVLSERALFSYLCTEVYLKEYDAGVRWNDADIGVDWPISAPQLSAKDEAAPFLAQIDPERLPLYQPAASGESA